MTSKDKLIEFLKSANIDYQEKETEDSLWVITGYTEYYFYLDGSFDSLYNY